jgi:hypothetical protein
MKKLLVIVALCGVVAMANAEYRIWFTGTSGVGLTNPQYIGNPSQAITSDDDVPNYANNLDVYGGFYAVNNFPNYPGHGSNYTTATCDEWVYIWGQFYNETGGTKVFSAVLQFVDAATGDLVDCVEPVWYKVDDMGFPGGARERWDGASTEADNYSTFRMNPQSLTAVTANGMKNVGAVGNEQWNLYSAGAQDGIGGRIHLLGAVRCTDLCCPGTYTIQVPTDVNGDPLFVISPANPTWPIIGSFTCVPEPASMLLLGLAGLLIRRR